MFEHNSPKLKRYFVRAPIIFVIGGFQLSCCGKGGFDTVINKLATDVCPDRVKITEVRNFFPVYAV